MAPSIWQILIIILVVLLIFGAGRLPRVMEDLAKGIKSFKKGLADEEESETKSEPEKLESTPSPAADTKKSEKDKNKKAS